MRVCVALAVAACLAALASLPGCGAASARKVAKAGTVPLPLTHLSLEDLLTQPADVMVTIHPQLVASDRVYGALLRRASGLAAGYAGPRSLGTTALAALERCEELDAAVNDAGDAAILLEGVPADLDVTSVVDETGKPIWRPLLGDVRRTFVEYGPVGDADATLFVLPSREWIVASGAARARTREKLIGVVEGVSFTRGAPALAVLTVRGSALVRRDPRLRSGRLAPLGTSLSKASFVLAPGAQGALVARLEYGEELAATDAAQTAREIVSAFRRILEHDEGVARAGAKVRPDPPPLSWLGGAAVERAGSIVTVRAPIPRPWLDAIARADVGEVGAPAVQGGAAVPPARTASSPRAQGSASDVPWELWRRSLARPNLSLPSPADAQDPAAQEPSQDGGSL